MPAQSREIYVNLPVRDLAASKAFFEALGFAFDSRFEDETAACMVVNERAYVMLIVEPRFAEFAAKPVADPRTATSAIMAVSADSREAVDAFAEAAVAAGATPAKEPADHGFMYYRSFHDLDGHMWEVLWMSPEAVEQGPADMAQTG